MPNILLTRIDNRLVHGQVGVTWVTSLGANLIVVVDDEVSNNQLQQQLMTITAINSGVGIRFFSVQKTIDVIEKASPNQKIFIVVSNPYTVVRLLEGGVPITNVNVGNMHFSEGKEKLSTKVYVDDTDKDHFKKIKSYNVNVYIQDVPGEEIKKY